MGKSRNNLTQILGQLFLKDDQTERTAKIEKKEPSTISLLLLIFVTLSFYNFEIYQLSNGVSNFVDTAMEKLLY
ncbi:MAG: hypothetical protein QNJ60_00965 [Xenococcaceae cyanobacterium MO_188.B19]|nr:hypothetical protein [Xenococcaceae cyanobacterium MO_188.B19]